MTKIGVFPAAGGLGTSIINHLHQLNLTSDLILIARKPESLAGFAQAGATVRRADYDDPNTLKGAFDGIDVLMLISYASVEIEYRVQAHRRAIDAARDSGVQHIFYSSLAFAGEREKTSVAHVMGAHLRTEAYLARLPDISYTAIREGLYSESYPIYTSWFDIHNPAGEIAIPHSGDGPGVAWVKRDELGEATAKLVADYAKNLEGFPYLNRVLLLSGPREVSLQETVDLLGQAVGKPLCIREISVDEYVALPQHGTKHTYHGIDLSREWASAWDAIRLGETAVVSPLLREILGREPESFATTVNALAVSK